MSVSQYNSKRQAKDIEKGSTASYIDIQAVLTSLPKIMVLNMKNGLSVNLEGFGAFRYKVRSAMMDKEVDAPLSKTRSETIKVSLLCISVS